MGFIDTVFSVIAGLPCSVGLLASTSLSLPSSSTLHGSHAPSTHLLEGLQKLLYVCPTPVGNHVLRLVDVTHDIMTVFLEYIYHLVCSLGEVTNMSNPPSPNLHTKPLVVKPYTFPDPSCQACVASILAIDPQLNPPPPGHTQRSKFSAEDLERLVCLAAEEELWSKPHGQITSSWKGILKRLQSEGRFQTSSITTIQNKLNALVAWQEVFSSFLRRLHLLTFAARIQTPQKVAMLPEP